MTSAFVTQLRDTYAPLVPDHTLDAVGGQPAYDALSAAISAAIAAANDGLARFNERYSSQIESQVRDALATAWARRLSGGNLATLAEEEATLRRRLEREAGELEAAEGTAYDQAWATLQTVQDQVITATNPAHRRAALGSFNQAFATFGRLYRALGAATTIAAALRAESRRTGLAAGGPAAARLLDRAITHIHRVIDETTGSYAHMVKADRLDPRPDPHVFNLLDEQTMDMLYEEHQDLVDADGSVDSTRLAELLSASGALNALQRGDASGVIDAVEAYATAQFAANLDGWSVSTLTQAYHGPLDETLTKVFERAWEATAGAVCLTDVATPFAFSWVETPAGDPEQERLFELARSTAPVSREPCHIADADRGTSASIVIAFSQWELSLNDLAALAPGGPYRAALQASCDAEWLQPQRRPAFAEPRLQQLVERFFSQPDPIAPSPLAAKGSPSDRATPPVAAAGALLHPTAERALTGAGEGQPVTDLDTTPRNTRELAGGLAMVAGPQIPAERAPRQPAATVAAERMDRAVRVDLNRKRVAVMGSPATRLAGPPPVNGLARTRRGQGPPAPGRIAIPAVAATCWRLCRSAWSRVSTMAWHD